MSSQVALVHTQPSPAQPLAQEYPDQRLFVLSGTDLERVYALATNLSKEENKILKRFDLLDIYTDDTIKRPHTKTIAQEDLLLKKVVGELDYVAPMYDHQAGLMRSEVEAFFKRGKHAIVVTTPEHARALKVFAGKGVCSIWVRSGTAPVNKCFDVSVTDFKTVPSSDSQKVNVYAEEPDMVLGCLAQILNEKMQAAYRA